MAQDRVRSVDNDLSGHGLLAGAVGGVDHWRANYVNGVLERQKVGAYCSSSR